MLPFKYRIVLISCLVLVTTRAETGRASDDAATPGEAIAAKYSSGVIFLTCYNGPSDQTVGTGFLISDDIIITNNHVIARTTRSPPTSTGIPRPGSANCSPRTRISTSPL